MHPTAAATTLQPCATLNVGATVEKLMQHHELVLRTALTRLQPFTSTLEVYIHHFTAQLAVRNNTTGLKLFRSGVHKPSYRTLLSVQCYNTNTAF